MLLNMREYKSPKAIRLIERNARQLSRCHTKYKGRRRQPLPLQKLLKVPKARMKNDGWGLPLPNPQVLPSRDPTLSCFLSQFLDSHDLSSIVTYLSSDKDVVEQVPTLKWGRVHVDLKCTLISLTEYPHCFSSSTVVSKVIVDTGASVWISPHKEDFATYVYSNMKIKDLSSTNTVAGKGIIKWDLQDETGYTVTVEAYRYHIPAANLRLLSPQVLIKKDGGQATISARGIHIRLATNSTLVGQYCTCSNLPLIPMAHTKTNRFSFWNEAFGLSMNNSHELKNILGEDNTNLSASQKEVLLWHQRRSHASI
jgi:hypothetical protein